MEVQLVLEFFRKNNFPEAEIALHQDLNEKKEILGSNDFAKSLFPMNPLLPPVKLPPQSRGRVGGPNSGSGSGPDSSGDDEFKSLGSSTSVSAVCSSEFTNPYARRSTTQADSDSSSSDRLSQFGTAREYNDFDMQTGLWYDDKDDGPYLTPSFSGLELDPFGCPSEDKFVMTSGMESNLLKNPFSFNRLSEDSEENDHHLEHIFQPAHKKAADIIDNGQVKDCCREKADNEVRVRWDLGRTVYSNCEDLDSNLKESILNELDAGFTKQRLYTAETLVEGNGKNLAEGFDGPRSIYEINNQDLLLVNSCNHGFGANDDVVKSTDEPSSTVNEQESMTPPEEIPYWETNEDEHEVFNLRIIHRKNRTGFEESKEFPIVLHTVIAGRYYITEYLGSAAFSKVVQAHDIQTGVDVCLKIIKNDKDFFDQSLDEIKLLKYVNKHDPADAHHILRLFDYFYHQEHLFIVCELLRANLYEFQKYNLESGGEPYFTMSRLQAIARQCLEALDYLHSLGIIHCDLKPENILIKSYSKCEIKVIDLGSSCFETDNLCLYVQSRSYRAPEVILGLSYGPKIDIWSLGCIMAELCSGEVLFPNDAVVMLLARMISFLGPIDLEMLLKGHETHKYFTKELDLFHINEESNQMEYIIPELSSLEHHLPVSDVGFMDFLRYLLQINPRGRPTARQALEHPWLSIPYSN